MSDEASRPAMIRESGKLSILTMASRVLGLAREMTKAAFMGTGLLAEAFSVAFMIPNFLRRLFAEGSMTVAFIPVFTELFGEKDERRTREFLSATFTVLIFLVSVIVVLGMAASPWIVSFFGSDPAETSILTRIMFPFLALVSVAAFFQGILNTMGVFTPSAIGPILFNVCFIGLPYLVGGWTANPARAMAIGVLAGGCAQALCQLPALLRMGFRFGFMGLGPAFRDPDMRRVMALIAPTILGMAAYQLNELVCTSLASHVQAAAALSYSLRLMELVLGVFAVAAGTVLLPRLTRSAQSKNWTSFADDLGRVIRGMILITLPVTAFSLICGREIITLLFKVKAFDEKSVLLTSSIFFFHMTALVFVALNRVIAPAFYARSDVRTPTMAGLVSFALNIVLAFGLSRIMRGPGIALALSISSALNCLILILALRRGGIRELGPVLRGALGYFFRILLFSIVAGAVLYPLRPSILGLFSGSSSRLVSAGLPLAVETLIFAALGLAMLWLSGDRTAAALLRGLAHRQDTRRGGKR